MLLISLASPTQWGAPSFAPLAKGGSRKRRHQVGSITCAQQNHIAQAAWPPTLAKDARMGHPRRERCTQRSIKGGPTAITNPMVQAASDPPLQRTQERGTHGFGAGRKEPGKPGHRSKDPLRPGHPPKDPLRAGHPPQQESNSACCIAAHPCKRRKDGAPSVGTVHAKIVEGGPPAPLPKFPGGFVEFRSGRSTIS